MMRTLGITKTIVTSGGIFLLTFSTLLAYQVTIESSEGGSVIDPGEGVIDYEPENSWDRLKLEALADFGYRFVQWTGNFSTSANPTSTSVKNDMYILAEFESALVVDTNALFDEDITDVGVRLRGAVSYTLDDSDCWTFFCYCKKSESAIEEEWITTEEQAIKTANGVKDIDQWIDGLEPSCDYVYEAHARNDLGHQSVGEILEFTTKSHDALEVIYVDDDAESDPASGDPCISDPLEDGSVSHPYDSIQEAIDVTPDDATVVVRGGCYQETLNFGGKAIKVRGYDLDDQAIAEYPIIDANGCGPVVTFDSGEDANSLLSGFILTGGLGDHAGAIACISSSPTIQQCIIAGNQCWNASGSSSEEACGAIYCFESNSQFENCTFVDNFCNVNGAVFCVIDSDIRLSNSIVWNNTPDTVSVSSDADPSTEYCLTSEDPLFADLGYWLVNGDPCQVTTEPNGLNDVWIMGDYHLCSPYGRYVSDTNEWVYDEVYSPGIDAGDPNADWLSESTPHGERINLGGYGGSSQASHSKGTPPVPETMVFVAIDDEGVSGYEGFQGEISKYEVTNAEYCEYLNAALTEGLIEVVSSTVYAMSGSKPYFDTYSKYSTSRSQSQIVYSGGAFSVRTRDGQSMANHPVAMVSWYGAEAFCEYYDLRLPTEWEWQAVADYQGDYKYGCGTNIRHTKANYDQENPLDLVDFPLTTSVGYYSAYGYGLCDMSGNVWEWTDSRANPTDTRVIRGGGWEAPAEQCKVSLQTSLAKNRRISTVGFRPCR